MHMSTIIQFPERDSLPLTARVSEEVKALMGRYTVNQTALAQWLGLHQTAVSDRLRGKTEWKVAEIERVAYGFAVHPAALLGGYATNPHPGGPDGGLPILSGRRDSNSQHSAWKAETLWGDVVPLFDATRRTIAA